MYACKDLQTNVENGSTVVSLTKNGKRNSKKAVWWCGVCSANLKEFWFSTKTYKILKKRQKIGGESKNLKK